MASVVYTICLHMSFAIVFIQIIPLLIYRKYLVFVILKKHLLPVYCFTVKQAGLIVIKSKTFGSYTLLCIISALIFQIVVLLSFFLCIYVLALEVTNFVMIVPPSPSFIMRTTFLSFLVVAACHHSLNIRLCQNSPLYSFKCLFGNFLSLSHTQNCLRPYRIALPNFHTLTSCSHTGTDALTSCLINIACPR